MFKNIKNILINLKRIIILLKFIKFETYIPILNYNKNIFIIKYFLNFVLYYNINLNIVIYENKFQFLYNLLKVISFIYFYFKMKTKI